MSYKVVEAFTDLLDNNYIYNVGDTFPHKGYEPSKERIEELASDENKRNMILIVKEKGEDETITEAVETKESVESTDDEATSNNNNKNKNKKGKR